jgi:Ca2+/Na+ antiporter
LWLWFSWAFCSWCCRGTSCVNHPLPSVMITMFVFLLVLLMHSLYQLSFSYSMVVVMFMSFSLNATSIAPREDEHCDHDWRKRMINTRSALATPRKKSSWKSQSQPFRKTIVEIGNALVTLKEELARIMTRRFYFEIHSSSPLAHLYRWNGKL